MATFSFTFTVYVAVTIYGGIKGCQPFRGNSRNSLLHQPLNISPLKYGPWIKHWSWRFVLTFATLTNCLLLTSFNTSDSPQFSEKYVRINGILLRNKSLVYFFINVYLYTNVTKLMKLMMFEYNEADECVFLNALILAIISYLKFFIIHSLYIKKGYNIKGKYNLKGTTQ